MMAADSPRPLEERRRLALDDLLATFPELPTSPAHLRIMLRCAFMRGAFETRGATTSELSEMLERDRVETMASIRRRSAEREALRKEMH